MSDKSNNQGRAFEYICLITLEKEISKYRKAEIVSNSSFDVALTAWNSIDKKLQPKLITSAESIIKTIFDLEPMMIEKDDDKVELLIQPDVMGEGGDVRDIVAIRKNKEWEIGFSVKHNHFAVKHSRLAKTLDFGKRWYNKKCSEQYWNDVKPIFDYLLKEKEKGTKWRDLPDKELEVYVPLLNAFVDEIKRTYKEYNSLPQRMVEYLLGEFDFYKIISIDNENLTQIQTFNLRGTLNQKSSKDEAKVKIPLVNLPTRLVNIEIKPGSVNKVELYLDNGWQFSFRIHNASTIVEPSLKFDIQIEGMPTSIISINCFWDKKH